MSDGLIILHAKPCLSLRVHKPVYEVVRETMRLEAIVRPWSLLHGALNARPGEALRA